MNERKIREMYALCSNRKCGFQECVNESKNNLEIKKKLDFIDILDVLISTYFFSKNKFELNTLKLMMLKIKTNKNLINLKE